MISSILKLLVKTEDILCAVVICQSHNNAIGKADRFWLFFELCKSRFHVRGRLDENELTTWLKKRVHCFESSLMTASLA